MNSPVLVACAFFAALTGGVGLLGYRLYVRPAQMRARLGMPVVASTLNTEPAPSFSRSLLEMLRKLGDLLSSGLRNSASSKRADVLRLQLITAGYRQENAPQIFVGLRTAAVLLALSAVSLLPVQFDNPALRGVLMVGGAGLGWRLPLFFLKKKIAERQERLRLALPDALDLTIISVEAGLSLDQAIQHVSHEMNGEAQKDLGEELQLIGMEMRAGKRRADALRGFADRTGESEIGKLCALMIQNDKFGTSMGEAMRNHSRFMRVQRKQQADETASKVGVKLVFPIFFFILPSMMVVAAGPGLLQIFKYLFPMMKNIH